MTWTGEPVAPPPGRDMISAEALWAQLAADPAEAGPSPAFATRDPHLGKLIRRHRAASDYRVDCTLTRSLRAGAQWSKIPFAERVALVVAFGQRITQQRHHLARQLCRWLGTPVIQALAEVDASARLCAQSGLRSKHTARPAGIALAATGRRHPFFDNTAALVSAWLAAQPVVLVPTGEAVDAALALEGLAGLVHAPRNLVQTLLAKDEQLCRAVSDTRVTHAFLAGRKSVGASTVAHGHATVRYARPERAAWFASRSTDVEWAAERYACICLGTAPDWGADFGPALVAAEIYDEFVEALADRIDRATVGDPFDPAVDVGPMPSSEIRCRLHQQVVEALADGASHRLRRGYLPRHGFYYPPVILTDLPSRMPGLLDEPDGPLALVIRVAAEAEARDISRSRGAGLFALDVPSLNSDNGAPTATAAK